MSEAILAPFLSNGDSSSYGYMSKGSINGTYTVQTSKPVKVAMACVVSATVCKGTSTNYTERQFSGSSTAIGIHSSRSNLITPIFIMYDGANNFYAAATITISSSGVLSFSNTWYTTTTLWLTNATVRFIWFY